MRRNARYERDMHNSMLTYTPRFAAKNLYLWMVRLYHIVLALAAVVCN